MEWTLGKNFIFLPSEGGEMPLWYVLLLLLHFLHLSFTLSINLFLSPLFPCLIVTLHFASSLIRFSLFQPQGVQVSLWEEMYSKWEAGEDGEVDGCMAAWSGITWGCVCVRVCVFYAYLLKIDIHACEHFRFSPCDGMCALYVCSENVCVCSPVSMWLHVCISSLPYPLCLYMLSWHTHTVSSSHLSM